MISAYLRTMKPVQKFDCKTGKVTYEYEKLIKTTDTMEQLEYEVELLNLYRYSNPWVIMKTHDWGEE